MQGFDPEVIKPLLDVGDLCGLGSGSEGNVACPFPHHDDHDPSCNVNRRKQVFFCYGCKATGDAIDFFGYNIVGSHYDRHNPQHFKTALEAAAEASGAKPGQRTFKKKEVKKTTVQDVIARAQKLSEANASREAVKEVNSQKQARYVADWDERAADYLRSRRIDPTVARRYGAGVRRSWQGADRITFPMTLPSGEIRQFYGRAIEPRPATWVDGTGAERPVSKGVKSSRYELKLKDEDGKIGGWFNAPTLLTEWAIYVAEGVPDALALIQAGYVGAVAPIGINLGAYDPKWFTARGPFPRPVFIVYNNDANGQGQQGALRSKADIEKHLGNLVDVQIIHPPEGWNDWAEMYQVGEVIDLPQPEPIAPGLEELKQWRRGMDRIVRRLEAVGGHGAERALALAASFFMAADEGFDAADAWRNEMLPQLLDELKNLEAQDPFEDTDIEPAEYRLFGDGPNAQYADGVHVFTGSVDFDTPTVVLIDGRPTAPLMYVDDRVADAWRYRWRIEDGTASKHDWNRKAA